MDIWPHRQNFKAAVRKYRVANDLRLSGVAEALGMAETTLKDYLYRKDVRPSLDLLQRASAVLGVSLQQLVDDPGASLPGIESGELSQLTPAKRLILRSAAQKLGADDVTDEQAERVWRAMESLIEAGKIRPPR